MRWVSKEVSRNRREIMHGFSEIVCAWLLSHLLPQKLLWWQAGFVSCGGADLNGSCCCCGANGYSCGWWDWTPSSTKFTATDSIVGNMGGGGGMWRWEIMTFSGGWGRGSYIIKAIMICSWRFIWPYGAFCHFSYCCLYRSVYHRLYIVLAKLDYVWGRLLLCCVTCGGFHIAWAWINE